MFSSVLGLRSMRVAIIMLSVLLGVSSVANGYRRAGKTSSLATFNAILLPDSFELQARETLMIKLVSRDDGVRFI